MVHSSGLVQQFTSVIKDLGPFSSITITILGVFCLTAARQWP